MDKLKLVPTSLLLPVCIVVITSLPFYIVSRLYPTLINFNIHDDRTNTIFASVFFIMIVIGSSSAFVLHDLYVGPFFTILGTFVAECITLIMILVCTGCSARIGNYISLAFFGLTLGILQTSITVFFAGRYDTKLRYGLLYHFHFYLLGQFIAYIISILLVQLHYPAEYYGVCHSTIGSILPLVTAIASTGLSVGLLLLIYVQVLKERSSKSNTILAILTRSKYALIIFIPFLFFWILTILIEQFWFVQGQNMYTLLQQSDWELIYAVIIILCIPLAFLFRIRRNRFLRMTVGGILIIISVIYSGWLGRFTIEPHRNNTGLTNLYACNLKSEITLVTISKLKMKVPFHLCPGPFFIQPQLINSNSIQYSNNTSQIHVSDEKYLTIALISDEKDNTTSTLIWFAERNFRSISTLPLIRIIAFKSTRSIHIAGGNPFIEFDISTTNYNIMELSEGEYNISHTLMETFYFRSGGYYTIMLSNANESLEITDLVFIKGYTRNRYYQVIQYILLALGKILILSSGLEISYLLAKDDLKCSIIGIFWGIYYLAHTIYYSMYAFIVDSFMNNVKAIFLFMMAIICLFYFLCYFIAYKMVEIEIKENAGVIEFSISSDEDDEDENMNKPPAEETKQLKQADLLAKMKKTRAQPGAR